MSTKETGGPAFPAGAVRSTRERPNDAGSNWVVSERIDPAQRGMSIRDYFAAKAMQGMLANPNQDYAPLTIKAQAAVVEGAYEIAEAMIIARKE